MADFNDAMNAWVDWAFDSGWLWVFMVALCVFAGWLGWYTARNYDGLP